MRLILLSLVMCLPWSAAHALKGFAGPTDRVTMRHLIPNFHRHAGEFWYSEQYYFGAVSKRGETLRVHFQFSNIGIQRGKASVKVTFIDASGRRVRTSQQFPRGAWRYDRKRLDVRLGQNRMQGKPGQIMISVGNAKLKVAVTFSNSLPPWRPGNGRLHVTDPQHFYDFTLLAPRANVVGTVTLVSSGETLRFSGVGYADHSFGTIPPHLLVKRWIRMRQIGANETVILSVLQSPGGQWRGFLYLARGQRPVTHLQFGVTPLKMRPDLSHPNHYRVPMAFRLSALPGSPPLKALVRASKLEHRSDTLKTLGRVERFFVAKFAKPVYYQFRAAYALAIKAPGDVLRMTGTAMYIYQQLNK